jgi:hypothetical protein
MEPSSQFVGARINSSLSLHFCLLEPLEDGLFVRGSEISAALRARDRVIASAGQILTFQKI